MTASSSSSCVRRLLENAEQRRHAMTKHHSYLTHMQVMGMILTFTKCNVFAVHTISIVNLSTLDSVNKCKLLFMKAMKVVDRYRVGPFHNVFPGSQIRWGFGTPSPENDPSNCKALSWSKAYKLNDSFSFEIRFYLPTQDTPLNRYYYKNTFFTSKQNVLEMQ